jgi:hypothetical protein
MMPATKRVECPKQHAMTVSVEICLHSALRLAMDEFVNLPLNATTRLCKQKLAGELMKKPKKRLVKIARHKEGRNNEHFYQGR